jgi:hypothetical protein
METYYFVVIRRSKSYDSWKKDSGGKARYREVLKNAIVLFNDAVEQETRDLYGIV